MKGMRFGIWSMISLLFAFCVVLAGCHKKQKKEINLIIKTGVSPLNPVVDNDTLDAYTLLKKAALDFTNNYGDAKIKISLSQYESARRSEEIDGCFGTALSPDVLFASQFNLSTYVNEGFLAPIDDILDSSIKDDLADGCLDNCVIDGKTYMVPYITQQNVLCFNKALFRSAGLHRYCNTDSIQTWTLSEWDEVLAKLKASLPTTSYPMMMYAADEQGDTHIMTLIRSRGSSFFDGTGHVCLETDEGIAALEWLRKCNHAGYFPPHPERLVILDNYELFVSGQLGIYMVNHAVQHYFDEAGIECGYVNFPSIDGQGLTTSFDMSFAVVNNGDKDKLKAAKSFIKRIYKTSFLDYSAGGTPVSRRVAAKYAEYLTDVSRYINNNAKNVNFTNNSPNWLGLRAVFYLHIRDLFATKKSTALIAQEIDSDCNAAIDEGYAAMKRPALNIDDTQVSF